MKRSLLALLIAPLFSVAQSQGPNNPSAGTTVPNTSCLSCPGNTWTQETNIFLADNNSSFTVLYPYPNCFQTNCYYSRYLYASGFNFSIPVNATILGVQAEVNRNPGNPNAIMDSTVRLFDGVNAIGNNVAGSIAWPNGFNYAVYGGSSALWGASLSPSMINSTGFGLYFKAYNSSANVVATIAVDHVRMTVWYSTTTGIFSQTSSSSDFAARLDGKESKLKVMFETSNNARTSIVVFDLAGKEVFAEKSLDAVPGKNHWELNIPALNSGIYFVQVRSGSLVRTQKVIME